MKAFHACVVVLLAAGSCLAQALQAPATTDEMQYLRFLVMNLASLDHKADAIQKFEDGLVKQFGLNQQETAAIRASANELNALLKQLRQSSVAIVPGKSGLTPADITAFSQLAAQREQKIESLVNRILNSVRPETAARLRAPGRILTAKAKKNQNVQ
jgi:hypothetical protein